MCLLVYIIPATLDPARRWIPLDLEAGSIVWAITRLRAYFFDDKA